MNRERLERAIGLLRYVKEHQLPFNMSEWFDGNPEECGTASCLYGWMARDSKFRADGWTIYIATTLEPSYPHYVENGCGYSGSKAGTAYFGVSHAASCFICLPSFYPDALTTPDEVIAHIEQVIAHGGKAPDEIDEEGL